MSWMSFFGTGIQKFLATRPRLVTLWMVLYALFNVVFVTIQIQRPITILFPWTGYTLLGLAAIVILVGYRTRYATLALIVTQQLALASLCLALFHRAWVEQLLAYTWQTVYRDQPELLQSVEYGYRCCGFRSLKDMSFPKPVKDKVVGCHSDPQMGFQRPCHDLVVDAFHSFCLGLAWFTIMFMLYIMSLAYLRTLPVEETPEGPLEPTSVATNHVVSIADADPDSGEQHRPLLLHLEDDYQSTTTTDAHRLLSNNRS
ncbi:hypothetical protein IWQ62_000267 [Dispira parvispora]|uniref:Tetraspanin n=1 Tax=Dispira parvispora TaxID=1520584 RepID=A0A9W8E9E7_9FUNG|nr:hypothetical protein IWQ62_000267 [Dispira parvispora]